MNITDDNEIRRILGRLMEGKASDEDLLRLLNWSRTSEDNSRQIMALIGIEELVSSPFSPEDIDLERAKEAIRIKIRAARRKKISIAVSRVAAALVLPILAFTFWLGQRSNMSKDKSIAMQTIQTPVGARSSITLSDGSVVTLNSSSSLTFPVEFRNDIREVTLVGEGFFEVRSDKKHPFTVHSGDISVTATGTKFNVNTYTTNVSIALLEGIIGVEDGAGNTSLVPGQILKRSNGEISVEEADIETLCGWKDGIISFRDDNMGYVLERLEQIYGVEFDIKDPSVRDFLYRGTFADKPLDQIIEVIGMSIPVKFTDNGFSSDQNIRRITVSMEE